MRDRALGILQQEFAGRPVQFLEVGIFEADTARLFFQTIGATPGSRYYGCDIWMWGADPIPQSREIADERLFRLDVLQWPRTGINGSWFHGDALSFVKSGLGRDSFDLIYIDSSHKPAQTLLEATLCFELLQPGGLLLFDDYDAGNPIIQEVRQAVDPFLTIYGGKLEVIDSGYQLLARKTA